MDYPGSPVRAGSKDIASVKAVQQQLNDRKITLIGGGQPLEVDGVFGPSTDAAVRLFQAQSTDARGNPLPIDGTVGPMTWASLFGAERAVVEQTATPLLGAVVEIATSQVGVREVPLGSNRGPEIDKYLGRCGLDPAKGSYAWCAAFSYWCFDEAAKRLGQPNPLPKTAGVHAMWGQLGDVHRLRLAPRQACDQPELVKPGMLFFLDAGSNLGHMGIVKAVDGVFLRTVEGNTTDLKGSREGIGVFERTTRTIPSVNLGFADATHR